jgi:hypothetical protein
MERTRKPTAAGILCIIAGAIVAVYSGMIFVVFVGYAMTSDNGFLALIVSFFDIPLIILGMLAIVGGIYALRRRRWRLALAGSISALICGIIANCIVLGLSDNFLDVGSFRSPLSVLSSVVLGLLGLLALLFVILGKREFDQAREFNAAIELNPDNADAYFNRGDAYDEIGEYEKAIADYSKAIELKPGDALAYFNRGNAYGEIREYGKAIADYSRVVELNPGDADTYYNRGLAYQEKGELAKAAGDLEKCIELSADSELAKAAQQALRKIENPP